MYLKVSDILDNNLKPELSRNDDFKTVIDTISKNLLGAAVVTENKKPVGIITDGDIRRAFNKSKNISKLLASDLMSLKPIEINSGILAHFLRAKWRRRKYRILRFCRYVL